MVRLLLLLMLCVAPVAVPTASLAAENCGNCVDDDGDTFVDRNDPECTPAADGNDQGIGDESRGKDLAGCEKAAQKAGFKLVLGVMKQFQKCTQAAEKCIQAKPGDAACQAKATATCAKSLGGFDPIAEKFQAGIVAKCDGEGTALPDLLAASGLGFSAEQTPCQNEGNGAFSSTGAIASCMALQHFCRAQHLVAIATPRTREFLNFAGRPGDEFPCIDTVGFTPLPGFEQGLSDPTHVKKLLKCSKTIGKLALALVGSGAKTVQACLNAGIACEQVKSGDAACLDKTRAKCAAVFTKLQDPHTGTVAKLAAKFLKACGVQENLDLSDIRQATGLGLDAELPRCLALGSIDIAQCFGAQAFCESGQIIERQVPRARELAAFLNVALPD